MELGDLVSATSERKVMCWSWNGSETASEQDADRNGRRMKMAVADAYSLYKVCRSGDQLLRRRHSKDRPEQLVGVCLERLEC
jgi:hypothetical protein